MAFMLKMINLGLETKLCCAHLTKTSKYISSIFFSFHIYFSLYVSFKEIIEKRNQQKTIFFGHFLWTEHGSIDKNLANNSEAFLYSSSWDSQNDQTDRQNWNIGQDKSVSIKSGSVPRRCKAILSAVIN